MAVLVRHFEAAAVDAYGAVAAALGAPLGPGEGSLEYHTFGAEPHHRRVSQETVERCFADLGMTLAVIVGIDPGLGRLVEHGEGKIGHALEHGHQPPFNNGPKMLEFAIHIWAVRQCRLMLYSESEQSFRDLIRGHCRAVVAHCGARQPPLHECLRQAMGDIFRALGQVPLQMAGQPRAVVENAEQHGRLPLAA